jgi:hypothetical protein
MNPRICIVMSEFIPIFLLFLFIAYPRSFVPFSHTVLGRLFVVLLIAFYSTIDIIYGALACVIVILYYQTDYAEGMRSINEPFTEIVKSVESDKSDKSVDSSTDPRTEISGAPTGGIVNGSTNVSSIPSSTPTTFSASDISNKRLDTETDVQTPKSSNDWASTVWKNIYSLYKPTAPVDSTGVKTEPFSEFK